MVHPRFLEHFRNPRGQGGLPHPTHASHAIDGACGDELELDLAVVDGVVRAAAFRVRGCSGAIAVASALASLLPGRDAAPDCVSREDLVTELGEVPPAKRHVLRLAERALRDALQSSSTT